MAKVDVMISIIMATILENVQNDVSGSEPPKNHWEDWAAMATCLEESGKENFRWMFK